MKHGKIFVIAACLIVAAAIGYTTHEAEGGKKVDTRVFELRTYYANPGKMTALHARFRDHTNKLFVKHGMTLIGYWTPIEHKPRRDGKAGLHSRLSEQGSRRQELG